MSDAPLALVTGSGRGIGGAAVRCLLADGLRVIALDRSAQGLEELSGTLRSDALSTRAFDLSQTAQIPSLVKALLDKHGPITRLVNNAGTWVGGPILELDDRTWQTNFDVNVTAPFALMRGLVPAMIESGGGVGAGGGIGAIVNVSSRNAFRSSTNNAAYDASKAALVALTRTAAGEFAAHGVRVNAVCPGVVRTPGTPGTPEID